MSLMVYLNGQVLPYEQASVPVEDRAFLLADGIYEVVRVYDGRPFCMNPHMERLARSAREVGITGVDVAELATVSQKLIALNNLSDASIYIQVSRGAYNPRTHAFPKCQITPTVLVIARAYTASPQLRLAGGKGITVPDQRWARCDIKSVSLLANVLAKQKATEAGAYEAIFVKDGYAIEGSSSNFMAVIGDEIRTYPLCNYILGGITREVVIRLARELGYTVREQGIPVEAIGACSEAWVTSSTAEIVPLVEIDGRKIGAGVPGPVAKALTDAYAKEHA